MSKHSLNLSQSVSLLRGREGKRERGREGGRELDRGKERDQRQGRGRMTEVWRDVG